MKAMSMAIQDSRSVAGQTRTDLVSRRKRVESLSYFNQALSVNEVEKLGGAFEIPTLDTVLRYSSQIPKRRSAPNHVMVNAAPKSGSSFVFALVKLGLGYAPVNVQLDEASQRRKEGSLDPSLLARAELWGELNSLPLVSHHHLPCSQATCAILNRFRVQVILQWRHVADCILSFRDYYQSKSEALAVGEVSEAWPFTAFVPRDLAGRPVADQVDYWIEIAGPWYFEYLASWSESRARLDVEPIWIRYESLVERKIATISMLAEALDEECPPNHVGQMIAELEKPENRAYTKFNVGVSGRWRSEMNDRQLSRLEEISSLYPGSEFGLDMGKAPEYL